MHGRKIKIKYILSGFVHFFQAKSFLGLSFTFYVGEERSMQGKPEEKRPLGRLSRR
jgi:hypothetical protein